MLMNTRFPHRHAANRTLGACVAGMALAASAWAAEPVKPQATPTTGQATLPYGSGYERRQWLLGVPQANTTAPTSATDQMPVTASPAPDSANPGKTNHGGTGPSGGRGKGRNR